MMEVLTNPIIMILQYMQVCQIIMLYTLNLHVVCQFQGAGKKTQEIKDPKSPW